ncbi:MAG: secretin N-terminal domain-containing protein [Longimicrobiales bacterium]
MSGVVVVAAVLCVLAPAVHAGRAEQATVKFTFAESVPLVDLVAYVSERTETRFIYDDAVSGEVVIRSPLEVRVADLVPILRDILEFKGYQLVEEHGWYKIRRGQKGEVLRREGPSAVYLSDRLPEDLRPEAIYTLIMRVEHARTEDLMGAIEGATGVSPTRLGTTDTLILTGYGRGVRRAVEVAGLLDRPEAALAVETYAFRNVQAAQIKDMALGILRSHLVPDLAAGGPQVRGPSLFVDSAGNRMILLLPPDAAGEVEELLAMLDAEPRSELRSYTVDNVDVRQAEAFVQETVRAKAPGLPNFVMRPAGEDKLLVVAPPRGHQLVGEALEVLEESSRFELAYYVPQHVQASRIQVLAREILGLSGRDESGEMLMVAPQENTLVARLTPGHHEELKAILARFDTRQEAVKATRLQFYQIRNTDAVELAGRLRAVLGVAGGEAAAEVGYTVEQMLESSRYLGIRRTDTMGAGEEVPSTETQPGGEEPSGRDKAQESGMRPGAVRVVADRNTNTIIVQAPIEYHETIKRLVEYLDRRRPQVLIEATVANVSVSSDLSVAVELLYREETGSVEALLFSAFGLSEVDVETGTRTPLVGTGANASIVDPDSAHAIIQALRGDSKSRVISEPKILVNDNATGRFESIREEPFTSVNLGETVSTTTFAGYAEAGLTIEVTPRISEGNFIQLDYSITSRDFTSTPTEAGIPPARASDNIGSSVTLPDGHTIVIGGLQRKRRSRSEERVPLLGRIPLVGALFRSRTRDAGDSRLFVFLRPVILRDDDFADLKALSRVGLARSGKEATGAEAIYPPAEPRVMR